MIRLFFHAIYTTVKGLWVTLTNLFRPTITQMYPEERRVTFRGDRGLPVLVSQPGTEILNCTACELCARACPVDCITIGWNKVDRNTAKPEEYGNNTRTGRHLVLYDLDASLCLYCGLCAEACPYDALAMSDVFELAELAVGDSHPTRLNEEAFDGGFPGVTAGDRSFVFDKERLAALGRNPSANLTGQRFEPYLSLQRDAAWDDRDADHNIFPPRPDLRYGGKSAAERSAVREE